MSDRTMPVVRWLQLWWPAIWRVAAAVVLMCAAFALVAFLLWGTEPSR